MEVYSLIIYLFIRRLLIIRYSIAWDNIHQSRDLKLQAQGYLDLENFQKTSLITMIETIVVLVLFIPQKKKITQIFFNSRLWLNNIFLSAKVALKLMNLLNNAFFQGSKIRHHRRKIKPLFFCQWNLQFLNIHDHSPLFNVNLRKNYKKLVWHTFIDSSKTLSDNILLT